MSSVATVSSPPASSTGSRSPRRWACRRCCSSTFSEEVGLQAVLFVDMGNAFYEGQNLFDVRNWRYGYGGGLLWFSPFGPLQLVLGFPVDPLAIEKSPVFEFSVGGYAP